MLKEVTPDFFAKKLTVVERLPKKMTSPFWLFNRALINNGIKQVDQKTTFALWMKLPLEAKRIYADCSATIKK